MALYVSAAEEKKLLGIPDSLRIVEQAFGDYGRERVVSSVPSHPSACQPSRRMPFPAGLCGWSFPTLPEALQTRSPG